MTSPSLRIVPVFPKDDQAWLRRESIAVPSFWQGHAVAPSVGDVLRVGGRQFVVEVRVWEHDGLTPVLMLFLGSGRAPSDTTFG